MAILAPDPILHFTDNNGNLLVGGQLFTYAAGTSTPQATFTDSTGGTQNTNPIVLNSRGEANVWLTPGQAYKFVLEDSVGNIIWSVDNINTSQSVGALNDITGVAGTNAITATALGINNYASGQMFVGLPFASNTGATTLNINGLGPVSVTIGGSALTGGEIVLNKPMMFYYNGTTFELFGVQATSLTGIGNAAAFDARYPGIVGVGHNIQGVTSGTQGFNITADSLLLSDSSGNRIKATNVNITPSLANPNGANGLDTGTAAASTWYYIYAISNGTTVAGLISASSSAPTLPSGYTYSALIAALTTDGSTHFPATYQRGNKIWYAQYQTAGSTLTATTETALSLASFVPPNALTSLLILDGYVPQSSSATTDLILYIRVLSGSNVDTLTVGHTSNGSASYAAGYSTKSSEVPNVGQNIYYILSTSLASLRADILVAGYTMPGGGQ